MADDVEVVWLPKHTNVGLWFQAYIGNQQVVNVVYVVTFGRCHITLVDGETELVAERLLSVRSTAC